MSCHCRASKTIGAVEQEIRALERAKAELWALPSLMDAAHYECGYKRPMKVHLETILDDHRHSLLCRLGELTAKERGL